MDYGDAKAIGDLAERQVEATLQALQPKYGFTVLHDVLVAKPGKKPITAQLDHVVIDQSGVLVIETKARNGALIRGTYADSNWTAIYGRSKNRFQNPLRQNEQHLNLLHQVLRDAGISLPLDSVRGLVVMVGADTSQLELDSIAALRVTDLDGLPAAYAQRHDFMFGVPLTAEQQAHIAGTIRGLNRSADAAIASAHAQYRGGQRGNVLGRPNDLVPSSAADGRVSPPVDFAPTRTGWAVVRTALATAIALAAAGILLWGYVAFKAGWISWLELVVFLAIASIALPSGTRRRRRRNSSVSSGIADVVLYASLVVVISFAASWYVVRFLNTSFPSFVAPGAASSPAPTASARPTVDMAKNALLQADPELMKTVTNPDSPAVGTINGYASFTWDYLDKTSAASVQIHKITIMLDASGRMVGVKRE